MQSGYVLWLVILNVARQSLVVLVSLLNVEFGEYKNINKMSGHPTTSAASEREASASKEGMSLEEKIGMAKKFDREMKVSFSK